MTGTDATHCKHGISLALTCGSCRDSRLIRGEPPITPERIRFYRRDMAEHPLRRPAAVYRARILTLCDEAERLAKVREVLALAAEMDKAGPDQFKTGQDHLTPAFREVNWEQAFKALAEFLTAIGEAANDGR